MNELSQQQVQIQGKGNNLAKSVPVVLSEPNDLYEEISHRLEYYNSEIEKLQQALRKVTLMRDVLVAAQNAFDREHNNNQVPGGREY